MKYGNGKAGAVNGMRPNGQVDITSMQSEEMWVGITAGLASLMIFEVNELFQCLLFSLVLLFSHLFNRT